MCTDCGCAVTPGNIEIHAHEHPHEHNHSHPHPHHPSQAHGLTQILTLHEAILSKNDRLAERNRGFFEAKELLVLNILSSPGAGKTKFLERMLTDVGERVPTAVIVGDLATDNDAQRLRQTGAQVIQITTGDVCHLEAEMIANAVKKLDLNGIKLLIIENVGNLVCPAAYDLGETLRIAMLSTTEGEDKPLKYPTLFKGADLIFINKMDIADAVEFDRNLALNNLTRVAPQAQIFAVSAKTGEGMAAWYQELEKRVKQAASI